MALTDRQIGLLEKLGLKTDLSNLTDEEHFAMDDALYDEMMMRGVNDAGDGLNDYGELCRSVIVALPDD